MRRAEAKPEDSLNEIRQPIDLVFSLASDDGYACAMRAIQHMLFNLNYIIRFGNVTVIDEQKNLFRWEYGKPAMMDRIRSTLIERLKKEHFDNFLADIRKHCMLTKPQAYRQIFDYLVKSQRLEDVRNLKEGEIAHLEHIWVTSCAYISEKEGEPPVACEIRFRGDYRVTQRLLFEAKAWIKREEGKQDPTSIVKKLENVLVDI